MRFKASTTVTVLDQETSEPIPFDEWTEADYELAYDVLMDDFSIGISVPFETVQGRGYDSIEKDDERHGRYEITIEVEPFEVAGAIGLDSFRTRLLDETDYVDYEWDAVFNDKDILAEGGVYGDYARLDELRSHIYNAANVEVAETPHIMSRYEEGDEGWHAFAAWFEYPALFNCFATKAEMENAICTGECGVSVRWESY